MRQFEIVQKIFALGATYQVFPPRMGGTLKTVKGKVFTFLPRLNMVDGDEGTHAGSLTGNFFKTDFRIMGASGMEVARMKFPLFSFKARFTLTTGGRSYTAAAGFTGLNFTVNDERGELAFSVDKKLFAVKDKFSLFIADDFDMDIAVLATVAVDQKYFQQENTG